MPRKLTEYSTKYRVSDAILPNKTVTIPLPDINALCYPIALLAVT